MEEVWSEEGSFVPYVSPSTLWSFSNLPLILECVHFFQDCLHSNGAYVKDLSVVDADLSRVCLVDNSPVSYAINQGSSNYYQGKPYYRP